MKVRKDEGKMRKRGTETEGKERGMGRGMEGKGK